MLNTIRQTRDITIKRLYAKVLEGNLDVEQSLRIISALNEEYEVMVDSVKRWERNCALVIDSKTMIIGGLSPGWEKVMTDPKAGDRE